NDWCFGDGATTYQNGHNATSPVSSARPRARGNSVDRRVIEPAHAPARLVRLRAARVLVEREIRNGDEPPVPIEQRNPIAHPRHDTAALKPRLEGPMMRVARGLETLAAGAETHVEAVPRPGRRKARGVLVAFVDRLEHQATFRPLPRPLGGDAPRRPTRRVLPRLVPPRRGRAGRSAHERREAAARRILPAARRQQVETIAKQARLAAAPLDAPRGRRGRRADALP